jgi:hypothetical protein
MKDKTNKITLLPRTAFSLFIVEPPPLRGKELESAIRNELMGSFPDNLDNRPIVIKKNNRKKGSYLVFVLETGQPQILLPVSTLFFLRYFHKETAKILFLDNTYAELLFIENGTLVKSEIKSANTANIHEEVLRFFGDGIGKLHVFCQQNDSPPLNDIEPDLVIGTHNIEKELDKFPVHTYSLYENQSAAKKIEKTFMIIFVLLAIAGSVTAIISYQKIHKDRILQERRLAEEQKKRIEEENKNRQRLLALQEHYEAIIKQKVAGPYETADVISQCLDDKATIASLTIKNGFFQMEVRAPDSLQVLKAFEKKRKIQNPTLQQIHPINGGERFTLSGTVLPEIEIIDPSLSLQEQMTLLELFIEKEETLQKNKEKMQPSVFGVNIRGLLIKWNCSINSYQYFTTEKEREIEFSIRTTSNRFFSFLKEASENNNGWIFTLVQIRNAAPQNAVDVVFRVKAETVTDTPVDVFEPYEEAPAARISRHYYISPAKPVETQTTPTVTSYSQRPESASWLEYIGLTSDNTGRQYIYVKNTRNGAMLRLEDKNEGQGRYVITSSGNIEVYIEGKVYEIRRR